MTMGATGDPKPIHGDHAQVIMIRISAVMDRSYQCLLILDITLQLFNTSLLVIDEHSFVNSGYRTHHIL